MTKTANLVKTANELMAEYVALNEELKAKEARKNELRQAVIGLVKSGNPETEDFAASLAEQSRRNLNVDDVIAKFGEEAVKPLIKVSVSERLTVRRKTEAPVDPAPVLSPKKSSKKRR